MNQHKEKDDDDDDNNDGGGFFSGLLKFLESFFKLIFQLASGGGALDSLNNLNNMSNGNTGGSDSSSSSSASSTSSTPCNTGASSSSSSSSTPSASSSAASSTGAGGGSKVPVGSKEVFVGDFETGDASQWGSCQTASGGCNPYAITIVSGADAHQGKYAARFEIHPGDIAASGNRTEVRGPSQANVAEGDERWYEFSLKFDNSFTNPTGGWFIVAQWHRSNPDSGSPPLSVEVSKSGVLELHNNDANASPLPIGPIKKGQWVDYVLHVKFSSSSGFVEAWENGVQKVQKTTRATGSPGGNYLKMGIYRDKKDSSNEVVYEDGVRVTAP